MLYTTIETLIMIKENREAGKMKTRILNRNPRSKKIIKVETHLLLHQEQKDKKRLMSL
jgi:hypothetical protein